MTDSTSCQPEQVYELEGMLVAQRPGATSTFEEYAAARATLIHINNDAQWNPWVHDDRASEKHSALLVMEQWQRAEPGFRQLTVPEMEEWLDEVGRRSEEKHAAAAIRQEQDKKRYDPEREQARLSLLEQESILSHQHEEMVELQTGRYPSMSEDRRAVKIAELGRATNDRETHITALASIVEDREDVVDKYGRLPRDRREANLLRYRLHRENKVRELRARIPELKDATAKSEDRTERTRLQRELQATESNLETILSVPQLTRDDMCSECAQPASHHGWVSPPYVGPCPAWPVWAERLKHARALLFTATERPKAKRELDQLKPRPIAVLPSGLPIAEVITKLSELQNKHPDAIVKRGRANRWEIWPVDTSQV
ncbi:hypothetical protein ACIQTW_21495 [Paenarthrobacter sp. NPDC090517]|uniref:hypothetical protein n=1 Tax=Paenarthrobacter sp. NPDC090517 TaxID=3364381 RepID=UPI003801ADDF